MNAYLAGCMVLGSDANWGKPAVVHAPNWGKPAIIDDASWLQPIMVSGDIVTYKDPSGLFDMNVVQKNMDSISAVTVSIAQALLDGGFDAINQAISVAKTNGLPGDTARNTVLGKLQWHQNTLQGMATTPNAMYSPGNDLKHWVTQAFVEANAATVGAQYLQDRWDNTWKKVLAAIAALPKEIRHVVSSIVEDVTGLPIWAWALLGLGGVGILGFGIYKLANTQAAAAVAGGITHAYMR